MVHLRNSLVLEIHAAAQPVVQNFAASSFQISCLLYRCIQTNVILYLAKVGIVHGDFSVPSYSCTYLSEVMSPFFSLSQAEWKCTYLMDGLLQSKMSLMFPGIIGPSPSAYSFTELIIQWKQILGSSLIWKVNDCTKLLRFP